MVARLPLHALKHAWNLRNMLAYVGSLAKLKFLCKLEEVCLFKPAQGVKECTTDI